MIKLTSGTKKSILLYFSRTPDFDRVVEHLRPKWYMKNVVINGTQYQVLVQFERMVVKTKSGNKSVRSPVRVKGIDPLFVGSKHQWTP